MYSRRMVEACLPHGFVYTTVQVLKAIKIYLQTLLLSDLLYIFVEDRYNFLNVKNMAQQTLQFNQAQLQLLDMMSFVKTPEALSDLNKAISDYFVKKADEEISF